MRTSLKASLIAVAIASFPLGSLAAGLGQINVFSGLGQPLRAEIQISATPQELQSITARVASPDAFRQANIPYPGFVSGIRVSVETSGQRPVVRLSSDRPINEPFVGLLVELDWASGRLAREYTFLLDPVDVAAPKPVAARLDAPAVPARATPMVASSPRPPIVNDYTVRRGDTLRRIAESNRREGANLDQMLIALFNANRSAFDGDNINRLRAGAILRIPSADSVLATSPAEARREVLAQAADFEAYRRRLAGSVSVAEAAPAAAEQASAGRIVPKVEDARAPADSGDKLQISRTQSDAVAGLDRDAGARLHALEEELVAREKGLEEANVRLAQLEQNIRELQKLLELKSQPMAQLQQAAPDAPDTAMPAVPSQGASAAEAQPPAPPVLAEPAPAPVAPTPAPAPAPVAPAPPPAPAPAPAPVVPAPAAMEEDSLFADPTMLAAGGGVLALLLAFALYRSRQRKKAEAALDSSALMSEFPPDSSAVFGATGGQSVDTGNSSILQTDFSQSGLSSIDADEGVDPVAEADVYMAYGRDAQAEEILEDALKADPNRAAIYLKLLEIFAQRQSLKQFETTASELYARTAGQGADWEKAALMGRKLDPDNPLYSAGPAEGERTVPPKTELPSSLGVATAAAVTAAAAVTIPESSAEKTAEETGPALSSLDFTTSSSIEPSSSQLKDTWTMPGDLGQLTAGDANVPDTPPEIQLPADEPPAIDVESIDFDLGGDQDEALAMAPASGLNDPVSGPDLAVSTDNQTSSGLDLDLGGDDFALDEGEVGPQGALSDSAHDASTATMVEDAASLALADEPALEFELPELGKPNADKPAAFDMSATVIQAAEAEPDGDDTVMDLEKTSFDASLLDFDFDLETPSSEPAVSVEAAGLDLTSIDLDLEPADEIESPSSASEAVADKAAPAAVEHEGELDHEVETKLELARAYDEMGDKEGALELLNEVLAEGSATQQAAARGLIEKLG